MRSHLAIVGIACRAPSVRSPEELWRKLQDRSWPGRRRILDDGDRFDAASFGMTVAEATAIDPQHRIFLECAREGLERAGYDPAQFDGTIGVFASAGPSRHAFRTLSGRGGSDVGLAGLLGLEKDYLSPRAAYHLGLTGPSVTIQTACSSSLSAVHAACQALLSRECDLALAGGVSMVLSDGDDGSSACGVVVLKRLASALEDDDGVHAVIRGTGINNDGRSRPGFASPAAQGQAALIAEVLEFAGVTPGDIGYVELHGASTAFGDAAEQGALAAVFGARRPSAASIQMRLGSLDSASGIMALIRAIAFAQTGSVPGVEDIRATDACRRVAIHSFGIGGANAHVVLEHPPARPAAPRDEGVHTLLLSSESPQALDALCARTADWLSDHPEYTVRDVAHTLRRGRRGLPYRLAIECRSVSEAIALLRSATRPPPSDPEVVRWLAGKPAEFAAAPAGRRVDLPPVPFDRHPCPAAPAVEPEPVPLPGAEVVRTIRSLWLRTLALTEAAGDANFFESGGTSVLAVELIDAINRRLGGQLSVRTLYEAPTLDALCRVAEGRAARTAPPSARHLGAIAIVGAACRFPGARDLGAYWEMLREGRECIRRLEQDDRPDAGAEPDGTAHFVRAVALLDDIELFDHAYFGISPAEAQLLDPQIRLFLETSAQALDDAGCPPRGNNRISLFAGGSPSLYLLNILTNAGTRTTAHPLQVSIANDRDALATTVSYRLNLRGPSVTVQTFCSTSLAAVHLARQSLLVGESDVALAGGVSLNLLGRRGYTYQPGGILSADGHCRAFDAAATGTVFGEGAGVVVLKRLEDAEASGDRILAVIMGSAMNNDGALKGGYTAPSLDRQAEVIQDALASAGLSARDVSYVEAHGTATQLGDSIEIEALTRAFRHFTPDVQFCGLGSVKSNFGHLDRAAGVASLLKVVLALQERKLPASLNFRSPNPQIAFASSPFFVNDRLRDWDVAGVRRAGVTALGIGGTNVHVVVQEYAPRAAHPSAAGWHLLPLSAHTDSALATLAHRTARRLSAVPDDPIADVAYTLQQGRRPLPWRRFAVSRTVEEAGAAFERHASTRVLPDAPVVLLLPGQGSQHVWMGRDLFSQSTFFRDTILTCLDWMGPALRDEILDAMYPTAGRETGAGARLQDTAIAQPALFAQEFATAKLWAALGLRPQKLIGHSIGELVAAALAGIMRPEDAARTVAERGRLMQAMAPGAMLSVLADADACRRWVDDGISIAAINEPRSTVLAGSVEGIERVRRECAASRIATAVVPTSHAFHSAMMDGALPAFRAFLERIPLSEPKIPIYSNVTGALMSAAEATSPDYWTAHLRRTVLFSSSLAAAAADRVVFVECGPGDVLTVLARRHTPHAHSSMPPARTSAASSGMKHFLETVGTLWSIGVAIDWNLLDDGRRCRVALPGVPLEPKRHWLEPDTRAVVLPQNLGDDRRLLGYTPSWRQAPALANAAAPHADWIALVREDDDPIADRLERRGCRVVRVFPGTRFAVAGASRYEVRPDSIEDFQEILGRHPGSAIVHLWSSSSVETADAMRFGFHALRLLAQAVALDTASDHHELTVVTREAHAITGEEALNPLPALGAGVCKVAPKEIAGFSCRTIDTDGASFDACVDELLKPAAGTVEVAVRRGRRWTLGYEPIPLEEESSRIRDGGVYWITGGTGGLGLAFAEMLARRGCRLILTHRSELPPREEWDRAVAAAPESRTSRILRTLQRLEPIAGGLVVLRADVCSEASMREVVRVGRTRFGRIDGAIHAAGVAGGGVLALKGAEMADGVILPKVVGAQVLARVLADDPPDFIALCSSIASVTGDFGQADYCAANAFLDAFAHARTAAGTFTQAINWGPWREAGMAVETAVPAEWRRLRADGLRDAIGSREGAAAFSAALARSDSQIVIVPSDLHEWRALAETLVASAIDTTGDTTALRAASGAPSLDCVPPSTDVERTLVGIWERSLSLTGIGIDDDFFALGGNSLLAVQMLPHLRAAFGTRVGSAHVFQYGTVRRLAEYLASGPETVAADAFDRGARVREARAARGGGQ